ncbi:Rrf2 family transcriptional regulator [Acetobacteraceae bacterium ESL0709]|nr:Rrf2 family transcriptional regulator [Acetobacteraceae bacterium ESL0697]MDF7677891.1 Rrf2 family transcriptional regulator [Acetobacteraceae bacterium ESL0709]
MRLTLHTDYALRTLIYVTVKNDRLVSIKEISALYGISENHMVKVIHRLGKGGFLKTQRGHGGGIQLARPPEEICIGDVIRHTEEDLAVIACMNKDSPVANCLLSAGCVLKSSMFKAQEAFLSVFDKLSLSDIVTPFERLRIQKEEEKQNLKKSA